MKISEIGEQGLLQILQSFCPSEIIGDDAAVFTTQPHQSLVVTTDVLVDNVHFSENTTSAFDTGWRSVAANLSDLAAMGATPLAITVGLGLPGDTEVNWVENLYQGMSSCLQPYQTPIVGGDVVRSPTKTIAITALGQVHPQQTIYRHTAQVDDAIVVTGVHGASRAGLELLLHPEQGLNLTASSQQQLKLAHQRPQPRLDVIPILKDIFKLNDSPFRVAGMDSSDGLADAVLQICRASGVGAIIDSSQIPIPDVFSTWLSPTKALEYALYGGEDFELVLCLPPPIATQLIAQINHAAIIGRIQVEPQVHLISDNKKIPSQTLTLNQGFQHF